jgi:hypothetical protein
VLHAKENHARQQYLFLRGGKYCLGLALFLLLGFLLLGGPFLTLWIGAPVPPAPLVLAVLALGEALPMAQWVTNSMILGMGKHKLLALVSVGEVLAAVCLALVLAGPFGLVGVAVAFAVPAAICRGVIQPLYGMRLAGVSLVEYASGVLVPGLTAALLPGLALALLVGWHPPTSWLSLITYSLAFMAVYAVSFLLAADRDQLKVLPALWPGRAEPEPKVLAPEAGAVS